MRYQVDFYDMVDGWTGSTDTEGQFDDRAAAVQLRDKKNAELAASNKNAGEHWGVIDTRTNTEFDCPLHYGRLK